MLQPVGPLPPSVYWRRRAVAAAVVVLVLALLVWAIATAASADGGPGAPTAAPAGPGSSSGPASPVASRGALPAGPDGRGPAVAALASTLRSPAAGGLLGAPGLPGTRPQTGALPGGLPGVDPGPGAGALPGADSQPGGAPPPGTPAGGGSTPPGAPAPSSPAVPSATAAPAGPAPAAAPAPPAASPALPAAAPSGPPPRCADGDLRVTARTDKPRYAPGEHPLFSLVVTNTGSAPCTRDLDAARQAMAVVRKPGDGLWGSNDCSPAHTNDVRTLAPEQEAVFSVRWGGRTSLPGCSGDRTVVPPGTYELLTRLDGTVSDPARFTLS